MSVPPHCVEAMNFDQSSDHRVILQTTLSSDCLFGLRMRKVLNDQLGLRSLFPSQTAPIFRRYFTGRAILEYDQNEKEITLMALDEVVEDIIIKVYDKVAAESAQYQELISLSIRYILLKLFSKVSAHILDIQKLQLKVDIKPPSMAMHPGVAVVYAYIETKENIIVIQEYAKHTALSISRFHAKTTLSLPTLSKGGGLGTQDLRKRFILYQLLQVVSFLHLQGLCLDILIPGNIMLDDDMWLTLPISISERACIAALYTMNKNSDKLEYTATINDEDGSHDRTLSELPTKINFNSGDVTSDNKVVPLDEQFMHNWCQQYLSNISVDRHPDYYEPVTIQWSKGKLGNFEYLMIINAAAGRSMVDPLYHPILPWVTDFSVDHDLLENCGYRDLSKTKFRLSKGDAQLETTYKHSDPPHHVPESISELTYYIYMARRTPMQVLRRVVRDVFVPEHYPHSVGRMYDWTPDECIPEFFTDSTVFQSIHQNVGLPDLELPSFASTPSDFITYHRRVIESDAVSKDLHKWIDLTFGHCLYGQAAIDNMNVPLRHTLSSADRGIQGGSAVDKHPGFVMLFSDPHPCREYRHNSQQSLPVSYTNIFKVSDMNSSLKGLLLLDKNKNLHKQYGGSNSATFETYQFNSILSLPSSTVVTEKDKERENRGDSTGLTQQSTRQGAKNPSHHSLTSPQHDPTVKYLDKLRTKLPIDMSSYHQQHILAKDQVSELAAVSSLHKFSDKFDRILNPTYKYFYECSCISQGSTGVNNDPSKDEFWTSIEDKEFVQELLNSIEYDLKNGSVKNGSNSVMNDGNPVDFFQNEDMFTIGCTICELFLGEPLLNDKDNHILAYKHTDYLKYYREMLKIIYKRTSSLPLVIQRVVTALVVVPSFKPKAHEILQACTALDFGIYEDKTYGSEKSGGNTIGFVDFKKDKISSSSRGDKSPMPSKCNASYDVVLEENLRVNYLYNHCNRLFPSYFKDAYTIIGKIKLCRKSIDKILVLNQFSSVLVTIPLEGLSLLLPQILSIIGNPAPFQADYKDAKLKSKVTEIYVGLLDVLGSRLGVEGTEKVIIPKIVVFFNNLMSAESLMDFLRSDIWAILIMRAGVKVFLSQLLPLLLTYLVSGTLYNVSKSYRENSDSRTSSVDNSHQFSAYELNSSPLWAALQWNIDKKEWIQGCSLPLIRAVQKETVRAITSLCHSDLLGSGLTCRYVVPALMCLVGVPSLAIAGSSNFHNIDDIHPSSFNTYVTTKCMFDHQNMYCVDCITLIASQIGERATADLILSKLFNSTLFKLEAEVNDTNNLRDKSSVVAALMEIVWLLNALLPSLSRETVVNHFIKPSNVTEFSLPKLLATLPLPQWSGLLSASAILDTESYKNMLDNLSSYIDHYRLYSLQSELIHLIVNISKIVDDLNICEKYILPHVDTFFQHFIETYGDIDIQSTVAEKAFELGASLFLPLVELFGPEKFSTTVHNLNPRLEMWLRAISDPNSPKTSPPLPSTILPEIVVDSSRGNTAVKKKGLRKWISEKSKVIFNTSSVTAPPTTPSVLMNATFNNGNTDLSPLSERNAIVQRAQSLRTPLQTTAIDETKATAPGNNKTAVPTPSIIHSVISPTEGMELSAIKLPHNMTSAAPNTPYDNNQFLGSWNESRNDYDSNTPITESNKSSQRSFTSGFKSTLKFEDNLSDEDSDDQQGESPISKINAQRDVATEIDAVIPATENVNGSLSPKFNTDILNQMSSFRKLLNANKSNANMIAFKDSGKIMPRKHKNNSGVGAMLRGGAKLININPSYNGDVSGAIMEDEDESYVSDYTWLLAGKGRWSNYINGLNNNEKESGSINYQHADPYTSQHPAAHLSMTAPRITVDAASETVEYINLSYINTLTMPIENDTFITANANNSSNINGGNDVNNSIVAMICNSTESILVTSSISGVRTWSLNNHPLTVVNKYTTRQVTSNPPQNLGFLRCGTQLASCNSNAINIWDIETNQTLECLKPAIENSYFSYMKVISPRYGVTPTLDSYGDDQIIACCGNTLSCHDFRAHTVRKLTPACEWNVPSSIPIAHSTSFITSNTNTEKVTITCTNSNENYIFAGSNYGTVWILDRRMGRILSTIQTFDSNNSSNKDIVNISVLSDTCILVVADGYSAIYDYYFDNDEVKKIYSLKNMPYDGVHPIKHSNIFVHAYGGSNLNYGLLGGGPESFSGSNMSKSFAMYCAAGHKIYSTRIPTLERDSSRDKINLAPYSTSPERFIYYNNMINNDNMANEVSTYSSHNVSNNAAEDIKLNFSYITDRMHNKVSKTKLHTTSMALLPLRKLLLLGTADGSIRVVI